jgi:hypothetical protein
MLNPFIFVINTVFVCAMITFLPSVTFAIMNSVGKMPTLVGKW